MSPQERFAYFLRKNYPWLVADWNGVEYVSMSRQVLRKLNAVEQHLNSVEERYTELENRLNMHANGNAGPAHRAPKRTIPTEIEP